MKGRNLTTKEIKNFEIFLREEEKSENTIEKYIRDVRSFMSYAGSNEITKEIVITYKNKLINENYAVRSINSMLASLNSLFAFLGWVDCKVKSIKLQRQVFCSEEKELTKSEYLRLVNTAKQKGNERLNLILQTICGTGIRVSELQFITVEAVKNGEASVTQIGEEAFNRCEALKNIVIPEGVKEIKHCTFYYCTSLERITIPSTVTAIDGGAFSFCKSLKSVIIPDGVIEIGSEAFYVCNSLESIIIPNSVTSFVGDMVFASCPNLTIYGYRNSTAKIYADEHSIPFIALDAVELSSISIATKPSKETYYVGDSLDTSGLQLTLTYSDGSTETVTSGFTTSGFSSTTAGTKTVTVTYEGKTTTFTVTVNTPAISLSSTNKTMKIGDTATLTVTTTPSGQSVTWTSSNTSVATVSNGTITAKAAGTATVTAKFTYNGHTYSQTCTVTVSAPEVTLISVSVAAMPTKTVYEIGDTLNTSGLKLKLTYSDGSTRTVTSGFTVSSPNMSTAGTKTVTVTYEGKTTTFTITVNSKEDPNPSGAKIIVDNKTAIVGNTVEVAVKLENNPGIASMTLKVDYDASVMKLVSVTDGGKLGTAVHSDNYKAPYTLCWVNDTATENFTANGTIVTLKFQILDDAVIGSYPITVSYDYDNYDIYNTDVEKVRFDTVSGGVTVTDILIGDVNSDGVVNNLDRLVLTRYLANWVDYPESTINMAAADVNMDGTVNNLDRLILTRHLANWNGYNELPYIK